MSIKEHYEVMTHEVTEKVLVGKTLYCDVCGKEIGKRKGYWELITGHNDWGHDSCDSIRRFDVCSQMCLMNKFVEYLDNSDIKSYNSEYFEVERTSWHQ